MVVRPGLAHVRPATLADVPATSPESVAMAKELKRRGLRFVGPTTCYALMQAAGLVDDHVAGAGELPPLRDDLVALGETLRTGDVVDRSGFPPVQGMGENGPRIRPRALPGAPAHRTDTVGTTMMGAADGGDEAPDR